MVQSLVLSGQSDSTGHCVAVDVEDLHDPTIPQSLLDFSATVDGVVNIEVAMAALKLQAHSRILRHRRPHLWGLQFG